MRPSPRSGALRTAIAACALLSVVFAGCSSSSSSKGSPAKAGSAVDVQIKLIAYKPATLHIAAGTTVTWHQGDPGVHTVTSGTVEPSAGGVTPKPDGKFASGQLATGKTYSHRFTKPGTYTFFCEIHPATMRGEITVS